MYNLYYIIEYQNDHLQCVIDVSIIGHFMQPLIVIFLEFSVSGKQHSYSHLECHHDIIHQ